MAEDTSIEWAHHTFNPWMGCTKVSPACDHCYAERDTARWKMVEWGPHAERRRTKTWGNPVKWNRQAEAEGKRYRVFCASLADVFDNHKSITHEWRNDLWKMIVDTPHLDWLLLTKRPQNAAKLLPSYWMRSGLPPNVWVGTTVENQTEADRRIPHLLNIPARVRFLSCEPLVGPVTLDLLPSHLHSRDCAYVIEDAPAPCTCAAIHGGISWVITGGESGPNYRPANPDWFRSLRDQCAAADVPFLFKQWEGKTQAKIKALGRELDGVVHDGYPE